MTVQQCKYVLEIAKSGSLNEAAKQLFIAQSSLSASVKQLEGELGIKIFERSNKGVYLTEQGAEFVRYAAQIVEQNEFVLGRYKNSADVKRLNIATQHYDFISDIFCKLLDESGGENYRFSLREIKTYDMIHEVETAMSDIGVLAIGENDRELVERFLHKKGIVFTQFLKTSPCIFLNSSHPLAKNSSLSFEDLAPYPYVFYDQGANNASFFMEELTDEIIGESRIEISDRATLMNVLISSDAYTVGTGIMPSRLNEGKIVAVPLQTNETYSIGYIIQEERRKNELTERFIELLLAFAKEVEENNNSRK